MFLLDTNVISEVRKGDRCDARVAAWYADTRESDLFISVIVAGEIRKGVERLRPRDPRQAEALNAGCGRSIGRMPIAFFRSTPGWPMSGAACAGHP